MIAQKIRNDAFTSFSTFGLVLILGIGGLLIVVAYTLEYLIEWFQKHKSIGVYQRLEWTTNETLQLQRLAHEELGCGTWSRTAGDHPVTAPHEQLAVLDISEPEHPRLKSSMVKTGTVEDRQGEGEPKGDTVEITERVVSPAGSIRAAVAADSASTSQCTTPSTNDAQNVTQTGGSSVDASLLRSSTC